MHKALIAAALTALPALASPQPAVAPPPAVCKMPVRSAPRCPTPIVKIYGSNEYCIYGSKDCGDDPQSLELVEKLTEQCQQQGYACLYGIEIDPVGKRYRGLCGPALPEASSEKTQER